MHFVNADASGRVPLTFGTYTVRFVNPTPRALRVLTKSTPPRSLSMPQFDPPAGPVSGANRPDSEWETVSSGDKADDPYPGQ